MIGTSAAYDEVLARQPLFPKYKLLSYNLDTNHGGDTWADIISGTYGQTPADLTNYVTSIDYTFDRLGIKLTDDPDLVFHPDGGSLRSIIGPGRAIRLLEGFEDLDEADWIWTFSGTIEGTYSWTYERSKPIPVAFTAYSRSNNQAWKRRNVTSRNFTIGADWSAMFMNVVKDIMLLEDIEVVVPEPWMVLFDKNTNQVADYPPWDAVTQLMQGISAVPFFNGMGQLDQYSLTQDRVTQFLENDNYLIRYDARDGGQETINKVILTYLSNTLSRVDGADQVLGTAIITAGFFSLSPSVDVYYSDERKVRSDNPRLIIIQSVNTGFFPIGDESLTQMDVFHARIDIDIPVYFIVIIVVLLALYLVAATVGFFGQAELAQALILISILLIMMSIGTGQYEVRGIPYEYVYLEKQYIAQKSDIEFWQERELELRNDFVSTEVQARPLVLTRLHYEVMKEHPRSLVLRYDPRIEQGDILQLSSTVRVYVDSVKRNLVRASGDPLVMNVDGWRTVL